LFAAYKHNIVGNYKHPLWMAIIGWIVVIAMGVLSGKTIYSYRFGFLRLIRRKSAVSF